MSVPLRDYEDSVLRWVKAKVAKTLPTMQKEPGWCDIDRNHQMVMGNQQPLRSNALSKVYRNKIKKIYFEIAGSLTDVRQIWNYHTENPDWKAQGAILNKLARAWWKNSVADRKLFRAIQFSEAGGSGYMALLFNPDLPGGGDIEAVVYDPRDVMPIDPVFEDSIQSWGGVILREYMTKQDAREKWPSKEHTFSEVAGSIWPQPEKLQTKSKLYQLVSPLWSWVSSTRGTQGPNVPVEDAIEIYKVYIKDNSTNTGSDPILMGEEGKNWAYKVYPIGSKHPETGMVVTEGEAKLYPRGRLIICTTNAVLYDGPNPYWHGMFPVLKFTLDPCSTTILGLPILSDLAPLQESLNEALRGLEDGVNQWIRRGVIGDIRSISKQELNQIDTRKAGLSVPLNMQAGEGFKVIDGPQLPSFYMESLTYWADAMEEDSGVKEFKQFAALQNNPSDDKYEKYTEALSPLLRTRSRSIELTLSEMAEMLKVMFFQFYHGDRRFQILGKDGLTLEDFDYDPGQLVPDKLEGGTREERAKRHHRNFTFSILPNSFLNVASTQKKMMTLQLYRTNGLDIWSMWEAMDVPNVGPPPAETVPERIVAARKLGLMPGPTPEVVQAQEKLAILQAEAQAVQIQQQLQQMQAEAQGGPPPPPGPGEGRGGPPPGGGGGQQVPPNSGTGPQGGRPPSGQAPPQMMMKSDGQGGQRMVVSESGR